MTIDFCWRTPPSGWRGLSPPLLLSSSTKVDFENSPSCRVRGVRTRLFISSHARNRQDTSGGNGSNNNADDNNKKNTQTLSPALYHKGTHPPISPLCHAAASAMTSFPQYSSFCISAPILLPPSTPPLSAACVTAGSCSISFYFFFLQLLHRPDTRGRRGEEDGIKKKPNKNTRPHLTNQRKRLSRLSPSASPPPPQWDDPKSTSHLSSLTPPALTFKSGDAARLLAAALEPLPVATHSSSHPLFFPSCPSVIVPPPPLLPRIHPPPLFSSTTSPPAPDAFSLF